MIYDHPGGGLKAVAMALSRCPSAVFGSNTSCPEPSIQAVKVKCPINIDYRKIYIPSASILSNKPVRDH